MKTLAFYGTVVRLREFDLRQGGKGCSVTFAVLGGQFEFNCLAGQVFKEGQSGYFLAEFKEEFTNLFQRGYNTDKMFSRSGLLPKSVVRFDELPLSEIPEKHFGMCK